MKLAIVHYHLNRGGVTQVIRNHLRSLNIVADGIPLQVAVFYGGRRADWPEDFTDHVAGIDLSLHAIAELEYDPPDANEASPEQLYRRLVEKLNQLGFSPSETVIHMHNHGLGKNLSLPGALTRLAENGYALLLQIHDFAEDFRPESYTRLLHGMASGDARQLEQLLYPQAPRMHYAVLNGRDGRLLRAAGISADRLHALPNPVADFGQLPDRDDARRKLARHHPNLMWGRLILYPVRGIRRKNVGELLLCSASAQSSDHFGLTLPPLNPVEQPVYEGWRRLAGELDLPCVFGIGTLAGVQFVDNLAAADAILTTSVAEGFGMVFLESWLANRPLIGRDLPEITADFATAGIDLSTLYDRLIVPLDWVQVETLRRALFDIHEEVRTAFGLDEAEMAEFNDAFTRMTAGDVVDFAVLPGRLQAQVIRRVRQDSGARDALLKLNPPLAKALSGDLPAAEMIERNAATVRREFSLEATGNRLRRIYRTVLESPVTGAAEPPASGAAVLGSLLQLSRLQPIRIES